MDSVRLDRLMLAISKALSRRGLIALSGLAAGVPGRAGAKDKKRKVKRNAFGCVSVGGKCRGKDAHCCSGVCQGKKPKKGEKDKSRCVAHDTSGCRGATDDSCGPGDTLCTTSAGKENAKCWLTTGNAGHCGLGAVCLPCTKDSDCVDSCGAGAACVICPGACPNSDTMCVGVAACN